MATIGQFQNELRNKAKRHLIEHEIGKDLIQRIMSTGGELKLTNGNDSFEFLNISPDLQPELEKKDSNCTAGFTKMATRLIDFALGINASKAKASF